MNTGNLIQLKTERLTVEIARPGTLYRSGRFDWSSIITQVTLDRRHTFCAVEDANDPKGGIGLCCEFGMKKAVAYLEAATGEGFLKPGIGILTRNGAEPYSCFVDYAVAPFDVGITLSPDSVTFVAEPQDCRGYAMRLTRRIFVDKNNMRMTVLLENTGRKPIVTDEYCHNFIAINGQGPGSAMTLRTAFPFAVTASSHMLALQQNKATWDRSPHSPFYVPERNVDCPAGTYWVLKHEPSGIGMAEGGSFAVDRFALWGSGHVVSPEAFIAINVPPGESQSWHRDYTFFTAGDAEPTLNFQETPPGESQAFSVSVPVSASRAVPAK